MGLVEIDQSCKEFMSRLFMFYPEWTSILLPSLYFLALTFFPSPLLAIVSELWSNNTIKIVILRTNKQKQNPQIQSELPAAKFSKLMNAK